jgi:hypothetical protein
MRRLEEFREQVEMDLAQCKSNLEPLESGTLRQVTRKEGS